MYLDRPLEISSFLFMRAVNEVSGKLNKESAGVTRRVKPDLFLLV